MLTRRDFFGGAAGFVAAASQYQVTDSGILMPQNKLQVAPLPTAAVLEGVVVSYEIQAPYDDAIEASFTIRLTHDPIIYEHFYSQHPMQVLLIPSAE